MKCTICGEETDNYQHCYYPDEWHFEALTPFNTGRKQARLYRRNAEAIEAGGAKEMVDYYEMRQVQQGTENPS